MTYPIPAKDEQQKMTRRLLLLRWRRGGSRDAVFLWDILFLFATVCLFPFFLALGMSQTSNRIQILLNHADALPGLGSRTATLQIWYGLAPPHTYGSYHTIPTSQQQARLTSSS